MLYLVKAKFISQTMPEFFKKLSDGTIEEQKPDGGEILASMKRATMSGDEVTWYETCFCTPPLRHEKSTVYDKFFKEMRIETATSPLTLKGRSFWTYLQQYGTEEA